MSTIQKYFEAFNAKDIAGMMDCLSPNVAHHVNEGNIRHGKPAFAEFCGHMARCYDETLTDLVIFNHGEGQGDTRAAAEYVVNGTYLATDDGLPEAKGQSYRLPAGSFFELEDGKISRVTTYYNLADWLAQISA
ncbi:MAG: isopropylmalate/homocitrate/citramalate synthase [Rhodobacterales bacterium]|nr:MAG: isopropylmalate/homocitrate/citramalate synthase [Rhodobacterales bacterium]